MLISALVGAVVIFAWRMRETRSPVTERKIVIPPLGMSTGFGMFLYAPTRVPLSWAASAVATGALLLAYPLIRTSRLTRMGDVVMLQRGRAFLWILLGLISVRLAARVYVERYLSPLQTGSIFFLLAFGMIVRWRTAMWLEYRALVAQPESRPEGTTSEAGRQAGPR
ncbi:MAG TPA: cytochrome c biogenesis protein CcdC [Polyangiales bacterium]